MVLTAKNGKVPFWMMTYYDPTVTDFDSSDVPVSELVNIWEKKGIDAAIEAYEDGILLKGIEKVKAEKGMAKSEKKGASSKRKTDSNIAKSVDFEETEFDIIGEDLVAAEEEIRLSNIKKGLVDISLVNESEDSNTEELDSIIEEGAFDEL